MKGLNVVGLVGRLVKDAQIRDLTDGISAVDFSLAVNRPKRQEDGNWGEEADFFDVSYVSKAAAKQAEFLKKGLLVGVTGELRQSRWRDSQTGEARSAVRVAAKTVSFLEAKGGGTDSGRAKSRWTELANEAF